MYATPEKDKAVFFAYRMEYLLNQVTPRVRMTGLDPDKQYKLIDMTPLKENKKNFLDGKSFEWQTTVGRRCGSAFLRRIFQCCDAN